MWLGSFYQAGGWGFAAEVRGTHSSKGVVRDLSFSQPGQRQNWYYLVPRLSAALSSCGKNGFGVAMEFWGRVKA